MDIEAVLARVDEILVSEFELDPADVHPGASLRDDLELDSLDGMDLIVALEKEFQVRVDDKALLQLRTVGDIHQHLRQLFDREAAGIRPA